MTRQAGVYLAGPMTGYAEHNFPAFHEATKQLRLAGYRVASPAEEHPVDVAPYSSWTWEQFLKADLRVMLGMDFIVVLPGWQKSRGARLEVATAEAVGIRCLCLADAITFRDLYVLVPGLCAPVGAA